MRRVRVEQLPVIPQAANILPRSLWLAKLDMQRHIPDFQLGDFVLRSTVVLVYNCSRLIHTIARSKPSRRFGDEKTANKDENRRTNLQQKRKSPCPRVGILGSSVHNPRGCDGTREVEGIVIPAQPAPPLRWDDFRHVDRS